MKSNSNAYHGYRFPREIIGHGVWLYHRFRLSFRDVEELLAKRGILVSYETIRQWCQKLEPEYARKLKRRQGRLGDIWYLDEVFVKIRGERHYLWPAVDQDGDVIDILVQRYRNARAAKRFFRKLLNGQGSTPWQLVTDKLKSYGAAHRVTMPSVDHNTARYENNRAEVSHQPTRQRERQMRRLRIGKTKALLPGRDNVKGRTRPVNLRSHASVGDQACAHISAMLEWDERMRRWAAVGERDEPSNQRGKRHGGVLSVG